MNRCVLPPYRQRAGKLLITHDMSKRINIVVSEATIQTIDRMAKSGQRSRFINQAVQHFVASRSTEALRAQLERTAVRDQDLDREIAADWLNVDHETRRQLDNERKPVQKAASPSVEKSTSRRSTLG